MRRLALLLFVAVPLFAQTIDPKELETLLADVIPAEMKKQQIPGAVFLLVQNGRVVFAKGYGSADLARQKPMNVDETILPIGSITKVFTGLAVVQLADRGALDLRADVNRYLKQIRVPEGPPVTAWHLLTHTAGFDELRGRMLESPGDRVQPLHRFLAKRLVRVRAPGEMTSYSSFGTALAGLLVEDVSGIPFERYLACNVWTPLKMHRTHITTPEELIDDLAVAYELDGEKIVPIPYERYHSTPASSINSTAGDMGRFMLALLNEGGGILSPRATAEMMRQQITMHPRIPGFGFILQLADTNGQRIVEHGGNIGGFHTLMTLLPDHETGFFIAAHREGADLRWPVRKAILDRWFPRKDPPQAPKANPAARARLKRLEGTYRGNIWCHTCPFDASRVQDVKVTLNDDGSINVWDEKWIEVEPLFFRSADGRRRLGFHEDAKGKITALTSGSWMVMERLPD
jgi:CubicO group peptidase (beta-lactamase class C family)